MVFFLEEITIFFLIKKDNYFNDKILSDNWKEVNIKRKIEGRILKIYHFSKQILPQFTILKIKLLLYF